MEKTAKNPKNRRTSIRKPARNSVKLECRRGSYGLGSNLALKVLDVSEDGARILIAESFEPKEEMEILFSGYGLPSKIKLLANVAWIYAVENGHYVVGVHFQKRIAYREMMQLSRP